MQIVWIDVDKLKSNNYNPNVMDAERFGALCDFLQTHSAEELDPIWARNDGVDTFEIIDGEHRWKAAKEVGWKRLRAFVIDMDMGDAKAFNVRKNRERGNLDVFKLGKILKEEYDKVGTQNGVSQKYGIPRPHISDYIAIYENKEKIVANADVPAGTRLSWHKARSILRELKREERGEPSPPEPPIESQQLTKFLTNYAKALKKNPLPPVQKNEVQTAIRFFKRLLEKEQIRCPVCGEKHLQWRCGHEF